ncbi:MAG: 3-methyladenine DNA glycosylase [Methanobrevibacter sp.]|uniref:DNA glycosylase n=1 Tax=Methanobrevibacter sp. TaxID=66852 RepID=UPI0025E70466|nr:DNA glycosylase [Methanobrevibacter sp.]MBR0270916.1 3-methyladenine DNA glycosylase [Methanobrevibacter sp.]
MIIEAPIDLELTQISGQTSQPPWNKINDSYNDLVYVNGEPSIFSVKQTGENIDFSYTGNVSQSSAVEKVKKIYDLDFDLDKFYKYLDSYDELRDMSKFCNGLRLFQAKDPFECIISSICSANNSIKRWTNSISDMKEKWGRNFNNFYSFPDADSLKEFYLDDEEELLKENVVKNNNLKACGVGYRAPYMRKASEIFSLEMDLSDISEMSYDEAFETVLKVPGVGPKVADCILLYGFGFRQAFPSDVWIKRIVSYLYFDGKDIKVEKVREFGMEEFGDYAGYVQLYMFHYARKSGLMEKLK